MGNSHSTRVGLFRQLETMRDSKVLLYVTGDRPGLETQIHNEVLDFFVDHLDQLQASEKITLVLYTRGGNTLAAWSIVNLIRQFCQTFEVIVPSKAHSAGTLICLGANGIIMTKQATLGPIDPSLNSPLGPQVPGGPPHARLPVSVEAIRGFLELSKLELGISSEEHLTAVLGRLADYVHPLVLGEVYRAKAQIQMLAQRLLTYQITDGEKVLRVISFLCSESGSHDYTINRREARDYLGLNVETPSQELYALIKNIYDTIREDLELGSSYDPSSLLGNRPNATYELRRALVESVLGGSHAFISRGELARCQIVANGTQQEVLNDQRTFEGWVHE